MVCCISEYFTLFFKDLWGIYVKFLVRSQWFKWSWCWGRWKRMCSEVNRGEIFLREAMYDSCSPPDVEGQVVFSRTKLAVKPATSDPSHKKPSHISAVIWTEAEKKVVVKGKQLLLLLPLVIWDMNVSTKHWNSCYKDLI